MNKGLDLELHRTLSALLLQHIASDKMALARHDLRRVRYYMLHHLYSNPGLSISQLSELSLADAASTSRMVYSMEKEGLLQRKTKEKDRRKNFLWLTERGEELYKKANGDFTKDIQNRFSSIDDKKLIEILDCLRVLSEVLEKHLGGQLT